MSKKERTRLAARSRRLEENDLMKKLAQLLPIISDVARQLDKAAVIRLAISVLKLRQRTLNHNGPSVVEANLVQHMHNRQRKYLHIQRYFKSNIGWYLLQALDGFLLLISNDCQLLYVSERISVHLGLSQVDLIGSSLLDIIHSDDKEKLYNFLSIDLYSNEPGKGNAINELSGKSRSILIRMKCKLVKRFALDRGDKRAMNQQNKNYKIIRFTTHHRQLSCFRYQLPKDFGSIYESAIVAEPIASLQTLENQNSSRTFLCYLTCNLEILCCTEGLQYCTGFREEEVQGKSLYQFCHTRDLDHIKAIHTSLLHPEQIVDYYSYKWLRKDGGWVSQNSDTCP
ncbi:uncharacterized protein TRIADDRAFT_62354 [Trichoplax adhaerens]|uniref:Uncharacterized protein n=1 Tax=Trichoplax adhaerens TaxID=10228 RepID=B3SDJ5_TRIAD|nr:hypothetical protein TRIADDRAFT_62354 [Trichoplax adhaerens]EDV19188.1 hypothetical protein TRIADDRAFT_62354 [Trichoplax adhaerens]|eukprot:XP_002118308.1 hypothetical protein TRIADDRAFT_62354 [Trichoplax adhaerens]